MIYKFIQASDWFDEYENHPVHESGIDPEDYLRGIFQCLGFTMTENPQFEVPGDFNENFDVFSEVSSTTPSIVKEIVLDSLDILWKMVQNVDVFDDNLLERIGNDVVYSRNGCGSGFWDRKYLPAEVLEHFDTVAANAGCLQLEFDGTDYWVSC